MAEVEQHGSKTPNTNQDAEPNKPKNTNNRSNYWAKTKIYCKYYAAKISAFSEKNDAAIVAISTFLVAIFTIVLAIATILLYVVTKSSVELTEKALLSVERPVLIIDIDGGIQAGRPVFTINIENVGKQTAQTVVFNASIVIQANSNFPQKFPIMDGSTCTTIPAIAQFVIKQGGNKAIRCRRQKPISSDEIVNIEKAGLYAFFMVEIGYIDAIGVMRTSKWVYLLRPINSFVQIFNRDEDENRLTPEQQEQNQRALIDIELTIEKKRGYPFPDK